MVLILVVVWKFMSFEHNKTQLSAYSSRDDRDRELKNNKYEVIPHLSHSVSSLNALSKYRREIERAIVSPS